MVPKTRPTGPTWKGLSCGRFYWTIEAPPGLKVYGSSGGHTLFSQVATDGTCAQLTEVVLMALWRHLDLPQWCIDTADELGEHVHILDLGDELRRTCVAESPKITFGSVHICNKVVKKRNAATSLLRRFHDHMLQHHVAFISGDFNMSACW